MAAAIKLDLANAADGAEWLNVTAWQGGGSVVDSLRRVREGVYRTPTPIPVHGNWKATLRVHKGRTVAGLPIVLPTDTAIPVNEVSTRPPRAPSCATSRTSSASARRACPGSSPPPYQVVLAIALGLLGSLAWGLSRFSRTSGRTRRPVTPVALSDGDGDGAGPLDRVGDLAPTGARSRPGNARSARTAG